MRIVDLASSFAACAALLPAQSPCEGNGVGSAYITTTPATWADAPALPTGVAFHTQTVTASGNALVTGGYVGDFASLLASDVIALHDGTTLVTGGYAGFPGVEFNTAVLHIAA